MEPPATLISGREVLERRAPVGVAQGDPARRAWFARVQRSRQRRVQPLLERPRVAPHDQRAHRRGHRPRQPVDPLVQRHRQVAVAAKVTLDALGLQRLDRLDQHLLPARPALRQEAVDLKGVIAQAIETAGPLIAAGDGLAKLVSGLVFGVALTLVVFALLMTRRAEANVVRKGGPGIRHSDLLVINKTDLAPLVGADLRVMDADARAGRTVGGEVRPFVFTNLKNGEGLADVIAWIERDLLFRDVPGPKVGL